MVRFLYIKRYILMIIPVFLITAASGISAQDNNKITELGFWSIPDRELKHISEIGIELGFWSAGIRYNWFVNDYFSLGARTFIHNNIIKENKIWSFDFVPRLMTPSFLTPYFEFGIGYGNMGEYDIKNGKLMISPGIGLNFMGLYAGLSVPMKFEPAFDIYFRAIIGYGLPITEDLFKRPEKATAVEDL
jgi:hypothetical protein